MEYVNYVVKKNRCRWFQDHENIEAEGAGSCTMPPCGRKLDQAFTFSNGSLVNNE